MKFFKYIGVAGAIYMLPLIAAAQLNPSNQTPLNTSCNSLVGFCNPLIRNDICGALKLFLDALATLGFPVAVLFMVYAGFLFVWARGSKDGLAKAKRNLVYTVIGIGIFIGAWVLGQIIANTFNAIGTQAGQPNPSIGQCK